MIEKNSIERKNKESHFLFEEILQPALYKLAESKGYTRDSRILTAPTQAGLQTWLRHEYEIHVVPKPKEHYPDNAITGLYVVDIYVNNHALEDMDGVYKSHEEALDVGLEEALTLIKN